MGMDFIFVKTVILIGADVLYITLYHTIVSGRNVPYREVGEIGAGRFNTDVASGKARPMATQVFVVHLR